MPDLLDREAVTLSLLQIGSDVGNADSVLWADLALNMSEPPVGPLALKYAAIEKAMNELRREVWILRGGLKICRKEEAESLARRNAYEEEMSAFARLLAKTPRRRTKKYIANFIRRSLRNL